MVPVKAHKGERVGVSARMKSNATCCILTPGHDFHTLLLHLQIVASRLFSGERGTPISGWGVRNVYPSTRIECDIIKQREGEMTTKRDEWLARRTQAGSQ